MRIVRLSVNNDELVRCGWATVRPGPDFELYRDYHDREWGQPVRNGVALFERMSLEAFQSGLSWLIILRKRENFRRAFAQFDITRVAEYTDADVQRLIAGINEQLWIGHFDLWTHTGMIMHRQTLVLPGGMIASDTQCQVMLASAIAACERHFPAFQFVVWAGKSTPEALAAAMFDTEGEA